MFVQADGLGVGVTPRSLIISGASPKNIIEHFGMVGRSDGFSRNQFQTKSGRDPPRDLALQRKQITGGAVEPLRPQMTAGLGIDELGSDANLLARPLDAAFE